MARPPGLVLYGPDTRYGAVRKPSFRQYLWYVVWTEPGARRPSSTPTGFARGQEAEAQAFLTRWLAGRAARQRAAGERAPHQVKLLDVLALYTESYVPEAHADPTRVRDLNIPLIDFFGPKATVSDVAALTNGKPLAQRYYEHRQTQYSRRGKPPQPGTPDRRRLVSPYTALKELHHLQAAINWAWKSQKLLSQPVAVWQPKRLPARGEPRWLNRRQAAALLWAAKSEPNSRLHLPLFILIGLYCGVRREAILSLRWQKNLDGGWVDLENRLIYWLPPGKVETKKKLPPKPTPIPQRLLTFLRYARRRTRQYVIEIDGRRVKDPKTGLHGAATRAGIQRPIPDNVHAHTLRHTCITWLLKSGWPMWKVSGYCGISMALLERVYGHHCTSHYDDIDAQFASPRRTGGRAR